MVEKAVKHTPEYDDALHMMETLGGSFVRALANCYYMADQRNKLRLKSAFSDYFNEYEAKFAGWRAKATITPGEAHE